MEVNCEGCAGCCIDWRSLSTAAGDYEQQGRYRPLDDTYTLVPLSSDELRRFVADGFGDVLAPRLFAADEGVAVDGHTLAAIEGTPVFQVGLRKPPKPVAPFDADPAWLDTCVFLDPTTLQCRIHGTDRYPEACATYPGDNLALDHETECERVEAAFGGDRLREQTPPDGAGIDPMPLGATVFGHPDAGRLAGVVERVAAARPTDTDRAELVAVAAAHRPGSLEVDRDRYESARAAVLDADSWAGRALDEWERRANRTEPAPSAARAVEDDRGAPPTPGWD
ncbi:YkgJ family cysteine cluster protein [Halorarius halobius]|uniref:YkgJ family cysteine cluster protein n=1 Tax=Halorarius halobius TaxID=2962671 RepID=UPI0020CC1D9F|nr:YkgJ family cysteine cluster protein [Halorarius halobius]